jgi:hypothetical protein
VQAKPKARTRAESVQHYEGDHAPLRSVTEVDVSPDKIKVVIEPPDTSEPSTFLAVDIIVNGSADKDKAAVSPDNAVKVALAAARTTLKAIRKLPDGTLLVNTPYSLDSAGDSRASMYTGMGFGERDPDSGAQAAIVRNGKLMPLSIADAAELSRSHKHYDPDSGLYSYLES